MGDKSMRKHHRACQILGVVATHQLLSSETKIWLEIPNVCQRKVETGSNLHENLESASSAARITIPELVIHSAGSSYSRWALTTSLQQHTVKSSHFNLTAPFGLYLLNASKQSATILIIVCSHSSEQMSLKNFKNCSIEL